MPTWLIFVISFIFSVIGLVFIALGSYTGWIIFFQGLYMVYLGFKSMALDERLEKLKKK